jgi:hypothetical protein
MTHNTMVATIDLDTLVSSLQARCADAERAAESLGVAAEIVATGSLAPQQMTVVAEGLRDLQGDLHDLCDALRKLVQENSSPVW